MLKIVAVFLMLAVYQAHGGLFDRIFNRFAGRGLGRSSFGRRTSNHQQSSFAVQPRVRSYPVGNYYGNQYPYGYNGGYKSVNSYDSYDNYDSQKTYSGPVYRPGPTVQRTSSYSRYGASYGRGNANAKVAACCRATPTIPPGCYPLCNFDTFSVQHAYALYRNGQCPLSAAGPFKSCASRDQDHSACCAAGGVAANCLQYCQPGTPQISFRHLRCLKYINVAKECFRNYLNSVP